MIAQLIADALLHLLVDLLAGGLTVGTTLAVVSVAFGVSVNQPS